jgi:hypothetical protein
MDNNQFQKNVVLNRQPKKEARLRVPTEHEVVWLLETRQKKLDPIS